MLVSFAQPSKALAPKVVILLVLIVARTLSPLNSLAFSATIRVFSRPLTVVRASQLAKELLRPVALAAN